MPNLSRRDFLKLACVFGASAVTADLLRHRALPVLELEVPRKIGARNENWIPSVCLQCPGGCGILARVVDGRLVKIEGNLRHPISRGNLCPKGLAGLQVLYDPDRIKGPMKRTNPRKGPGEDPNFVEISWDEALDIVAYRLKEIRNRGEPHKLVVMSGRSRGQMSVMWSRFLQAFGSPNDVNHSSIGSDAGILANYVMDGNKNYVGYDWPNTNYILSFGASMVEAWRPQVHLMGMWSHVRQERRFRAKTVLVDPRFSITASKADEWVPIRVGTDAALALGMAHVIIRDNLYDHSFIKKYTYGFEEWWQQAVKEMTPERSAEITGISAGAISRLAREFATTKPAVVCGERGAEAHTNGMYNKMCINALNALVGSIDSLGGTLYQIDPPYPDYPPVVQDEVAQRGLEQPRIDRKPPLAKNLYQNMADRILNDDPYPVNVLMIYYTNPLHSSPNVGSFMESFKKVPFIVDTSPFMSETAAYADVILPDHTYLERYQDDPIDPCLGYPVAGLRQPVVSPLYDTRNTGDVIIHLAKRIGGPVAESFPWGGFEDVLRYLVTGLGITWDEWKKTGVWTNPTYPYGHYRGVDRPSFKTPSGKFEFKSLSLESLGYNPFPHYEPPKFAGSASKYPLNLITYKLMTHAEGRGYNVPWLLESYGVEPKEGWDNWVEINTETARELRISDGDLVWVESPVGKIEVKAVVTEGIQPDTVAIPYGMGHWAYGRWAKDRGVNVNSIIANVSDPVSGQCAYNDTRVKVYKAG